MSFVVVVVVVVVVIVVVLLKLMLSFRGFEERCKPVHCVHRTCSESSETRAT